MRASLLVVVLFLPQLTGCASTNPYWTPEARVCNTPGRQELAQRIRLGGGALVRERSRWDDSVDAATKAEMGPPLSEVVMPRDAFSDQEIAEAKNIFREARVLAPPTLADYDAHPDFYLRPDTISWLEEHKTVQD